MTAIACFWLDPVPFARRTLRRYHPGAGRDCRGGRLSYHNAEVTIEERVPWAEAHHGLGDDSHDHDDPRWPVACACGYVFAPEDAWQHNLHRLFERSDGLTPATLQDAPPGAMWDAAWMGADCRGPDGLALCLRTPGGDWLVDGQSSGGGRWSRSGKPPEVTANPSILIGSPGIGSGVYHGWLRAGVLVGV